MISKKLIKDFEFENIDQFFNYIVQCKINGNGYQRMYYKKLSNKQRLEFLKFVYAFHSFEIYKYFHDLRLDNKE